MAIAGAPPPGAWSASPKTPARSNSPFSHTHTARYIPYMSTHSPLPYLLTLSLTLVLLAAMCVSFHPSITWKSPWLIVFVSVLTVCHHRLLPDPSPHREARAWRHLWIPTLLLSLSWCFLQVAGVPWGCDVPSHARPQEHYHPSGRRHCLSSYRH